MKNKLPSRDVIVKGWGRVCILVWGLSLACSWAWGSSDLDRQFKLETIGFLRARDNVDGLFADYVAAAYKDYFSRQSRFVVNDLSRADNFINNSKIPYYKIIQDPDILGQLARSTRTESIIRTEIIKEGTQYTFTLDWLHSPQMEALASEKFTIDEPSNGSPFGSDMVSDAIQVHVTKLIAKVPFLANVTGRDNNSVTVDIGSSSNIKKGDILVVATLDEVKKHPLLKAIVDWRLTPTGKLQVEQTEEGMAFCKVLEEEPGREIFHYQKVVQIQNVAPPAAPLVVNEAAEGEKKADEPPRLGWVGTSLLIGGTDRQFSSVAGGISNSGGGFDLGAKAEGEVWFTKSWFSNIEFRYDFWTFSQHNASTGVQTPASENGGVPGSLFSFKLDFGYSYLITGDIFGPRGWVKLGYKNNSYSLPLVLEAALESKQKYPHNF